MLKPNFPNQIEPSFDEEFRRVPHNIEAEQAILGALLINNNCYDRISGFLKSDHFFDPVHQRIFDCIEKLVQSGKLASPITLKLLFENEEPIGEITVSQYLGRLSKYATTVINAHEYGLLIKELAIRRALIVEGENMVLAAYETSIDVPIADVIEDVEQALYRVAENGGVGEYAKHISHGLSDAVESANQARERKGGLAGLATGLRDLDRKYGGLRPSDLIIVAGRPAMGKTALATIIAKNVAQMFFDEGKKRQVAYYSLEMSSEQLASRLISAQSRIPFERVHRGYIDDSELAQVVDASRVLDKLPLYIDQTGALSIGQLASRARRQKRTHGLDFMVIDYLQLMCGSAKRRGDGRMQEITEITMALKALAKELNIPIMVLSQLSRNVEYRDDKRPQLSDLRESGSIEQDADGVIFVHREEYYLALKEPKTTDVSYFDWGNEMAKVRGKADLTIAKHRHGPTGKLVLSFNGELTLFSDLHKGDSK